MTRGFQPVWLLPIALFMVSCGAHSGSTQSPVVTRSTIDFILDAPQPPPAWWEKVRIALFPTSTESAFELERKADLVAYYETDGRIRIDSIAGNKTEFEGSPDELAVLLGLYQKMALVVVVVAKNSWDDAELASHVAFINAHFTSLGFRRIVIQQALGSGRPTHSDISPGSVLQNQARRGPR